MTIHQIGPVPMRGHCASKDQPHALPGADYSPLGRRAEAMIDLSTCMLPVSIKRMQHGQTLSAQSVALGYKGKVDPRQFLPIGVSPMRGQGATPGTDVSSQ